VKEFHPSLTCGFAVIDGREALRSGGVEPGVHDEVVDDGPAVGGQVVNEALVAGAHDAVLDEQAQLRVDRARRAAGIPSHGGDGRPSGRAVILGMVGVGDEYEMGHGIVR
jgi:hypothetical protein